MRSREAVLRNGSQDLSSGGSEDQWSAGSTNPISEGSEFLIGWLQNLKHSLSYLKILQSCATTLGITFSQKTDDYERGIRRSKNTIHDLPLGPKIDHREVRAARRLRQERYSEQTVT
jgi:hypothetical protein